MKNKLGLLLILIILGGTLFWFQHRNNSQVADVVIKKITPAYNDLRVVISATGTVEPQNRLEIKPQVSGRIEEILFNEGDHVKKGSILAWMSSTERAALLDAARTQGPAAVKYWQDVYKPTPLISPIDGEVIVRTLEPGQSIDLSTPVLVISDRLIIKAQVDETDIGRIKIGQPVEINLDAYPDLIIKGSVVHIAYESTLVNNVIIYDVDISPLGNRNQIRSGMGANVSIIEKQKIHALTLPLEAIHAKDGANFVLKSSSATGNEPVKQLVTLGLSDDKQAEILTGLTPEDQVIVKEKNLQLSKKRTGTSPFIPTRRPGGAR